MPPLSLARPVSIGAIIVACITGCTDGNNASPLTGPVAPLPALSSPHASASLADVILVADVEQLYAAINDPANDGAMLLLAPGTYVLSAKTASGANRPNAGRLELREDMSVSGVAGDRAAVVIDATGLPQSSFTMSFGRTGVFRTGQGSNAIEWLTIAGNPLAAAAIETELVGNPPEARVRVAHVVAGNSARGVDVRNVGAAMAGRRLHAEIIDNEFFRGVEGIRVANFVGAHGGDISVIMSGNRSYQNVLGCIVESNRSNSGTIYVRSSGDRFEDNGLGCQIGAGLASSATADSNSTVFDCHGSHFSNNRRTAFFNNTGPDFQHFGGVLVAAGDVIATGGAAATSNNAVAMRLWGCKVEANQNADFEAYGAQSRDPAKIAGVDNHTTIELHGVSKRIDVLSVNSSPVDPSGSNTSTVIR